MRVWWNWQTRMIQVHMPTSMQVQVLLPAPRRSKLYIACSGFFILKNRNALTPLLLLFRKKSRLQARLRRLRCATNFLRVPPCGQLFWVQSEMLVHPNWAGLPSDYNPNLFPIGDRFGVIFYLPKMQNHLFLKKCRRSRFHGAPAFCIFILFWPSVVPFLPPLP